MKVQAITRMAGSVTAQPGDVIDVPGDLATALIAGGYAKVPDDEEGDTSASEPDEPTDLDEADESDVADLFEGEEEAAAEVDWYSVLVSDLDLDDDIKQHLVSQDLPTVGLVVDYDKDHGGLTKLDGIGKVSQRKIRDAIAKLKESAGAAE